MLNVGDFFDKLIYGIVLAMNAHEPNIGYGMQLPKMSADVPPDLFRGHIPFMVREHVFLDPVDKLLQLRFRDVHLHAGPLDALENIVTTVGYALAARFDHRDAQLFLHAFLRCETPSAGLTNPPTADGGATFRQAGVDHLVIAIFASRTEHQAAHDEVRWASPRRFPQ